VVSAARQYKVRILNVPASFCEVIPMGGLTVTDGEVCADANSLCAGCGGSIKHRQMGVVKMEGIVVLLDTFGDIWLTADKSAQR
jgi:hypothetical protein